MFDIDRIEVSFDNERKARWKFARRTVRGMEITYQVSDLNYPSRRDWTFVVRVPDRLVGHTYVEVRPLAAPNRSVWAGLDRKAIELRRGTMPNHRSKVYAKVAISDSTGDKTKRVLQSRHEMPRWLRAFRAVKKSKVTRTRGHDGPAPVIVIPLDDYPRMIRLFIALKAWVLERGFNPDERKRKARRATQPTRLRINPDLKGLYVTPSGRLGMGTRRDVRRWLKRLGAKARTRVSGKTDLVLEGSHFLGDDRRKITDAKRLGVPRISEAAFRRKFRV